MGDFIDAALKDGVIREMLLVSDVFHMRALEDADVQERLMKSKSFIEAALEDAGIMERLVKSIVKSKIFIKTALNDSNVQKMLLQSDEFEAARADNEESKDERRALDSHSSSIKKEGVEETVVVKKELP